MRRPTLLLAAALCLAACRDSERPLFKLLSPSETGISFANTITTSDTLNVQTDVYVYNGAGVAVGDIDNDGLPDVFFSGNQVSSRLYLNKGNLKFEDITQSAGVTTSRWATGATMVDINRDGYLDIYVSVSGPEKTKAAQRANLLFVNNGNRTFTEAAAQYGIADTGFTTHAVFLDYDADGCVDLFLLENSPKDFSRADVANHPTGKRGQTPDSYNQMYRNTCHGKFVNVTKNAGILQDVGYGLGVAVGDLNGDGRPDIYVSNDAQPNDVVYVNNGDGTFTNKAAQWFKHTSVAGMGVDIADFNDDGWPDVVQVDMMARTLNGKKRMSGFATYGSMLELRARGFREDANENSLQLNGGATKDGNVIFSDVARLAGVAATDWSWAPLFADFDNDGHKDLFISNGYPKVVNDLDYQTAMFALRRNRDSALSRRKGYEMLEKLHAYDASNYVFRNSGDLTFVDKTRDWGLERPSLSYGAAYADLDNNGTLDLVVNNIDGPAFVYENVGARPTEAGNHYLEVKLQGSVGGLGAKLILTAAGRKQHIYCSPYRGYMSTVDDRAHFGLGGARKVDSLEVLWPDGRRQLLTNLDADRLVVVKQQDATGGKDDLVTQAAKAAESVRPFEALDASAVGLAYKHRAVSLVDYSVQPLLPYMISRQGPALAVADVNGDGLDDIYVGGGARVPGQVFLQRKVEGDHVGFVAASGPWAADSSYEDWGAVFFDANGDGRPDLYVASGGYHLAPSSRWLQDRLYINTTAGFVRDTLALPEMLTSTAAVRVGDYDGDGQPDLFVGGRLTPRSYPSPTRSYLLHNDKGRFTDVTLNVVPALLTPGGMITDASWMDFDGDGRLDLVTVGEWMPIRFFHNDGKRLVEVTRSAGLPKMSGWWYSLAQGDFDGDGRPDLVAGNLGLNFAYSTSPGSRFGVYAADFNRHQTTDVVLTKEQDGSEYPFAGLVPLGRELYSLGLRFPTYGAFADARIDQLFGKTLGQAVHYQADTFASVYLHNDGGGKFSASPLPSLAQIAPIKAIIPTDVDHDGHLDLVLAGNLLDTEPNTPRADAGNGLWLRGDGKGHFTAIAPGVSGFLAPSNVAGLGLVRTASGAVVVIANTGDSLGVFSIRAPK